MFDVIRSAKLGFAALFAAAVLTLGGPTQSQAQTGSVRIKIIKAGFIVGVGGGSGTLHYHGRNYPFRVGGISIGTIGAAGADLVGRAYNLRSPADIAGTYTALSGSVAIAGGAKVARLQNANGVVLELHGVQAGFELSFSLSGMNIALR